ncbi:ATP-binding protein [Tengunoibacter tsumagoiensis]|uniref:histidine kinase n=1 Tax=Tengunoibacter tsumagoiensis TaxID=2014871 RepID=A0A402A0U4_9CHLR|nr:ATP-binding protein [Tengunoibacter tsumagoiensis]GCE12767.1 hypothetical protein KTT_26260 [Tengunoibacter tsumagoiensis]
MKSIYPVLFLGAQKEQWKKRLCLDSLLGFFSALIATTFIYLFRLYPAIPNISILFLLVVLAMASKRGLYAAILTSLVAFFSFDFLLVRPLFTFSMDRFDELLALCIFLVTAILTGELASALQQRAAQATARANETLALYELVKATTSAQSLERQLETVAQAIMKNFAGVGIFACAIILHNERGQLELVVEVPGHLHPTALSAEQESIIANVLMEGKPAEIPASSQTVELLRGRALRPARIAEKYVFKVLPLQTGNHCFGAIRLLVQKNSQRIWTRPTHGHEDDSFQQPATFFWTFLDQATAMIERSRLQSEALQVELLQQTDALRLALLSSISHDLRTPLSSIKASATSLLQEDVDWDEESRASFVVAIEREADRLNRLVGNLLDMSRIEGGALQLETEWYPLDEVIHDVVGRMQVVLEKRPILFAIPDNLPPVELEYLLIDQVLTNLLENVVRYTPEGSPITIRVREQEASLLVCIMDEGPGIPAHALERIFDKFYRVSETARRATSVMGTGLGLAVCRGLIEAHGGKIWAENRSQGGAQFCFTLPLRAIEGSK